MSYIPFPNPLPINLPELQIVETGMYAGRATKIYNIFGYRNQWNSNTALGDCAAYLVGGQDSINTPSVGTTYYVNSTSAQDATGGSGVDRVRIVYLNAAGNQLVTTANVNGTTAVSIGSGFSAIQWMEAYHSVSANRVAAGNITISSINGVATEATTMEMILASGNRSQSFRYTVPTGYHAHLLDYDLQSIIGGNGASVKLRATVFSDDDSLSNAFHFLDISNLPVSTGSSTDLHYRKIPAGAVIKLSCIPSQIASGNRLTGSMHFMLMAD